MSEQKARKEHTTCSFTHSSLSQRIGINGVNEVHDIEMPAFSSEVNWKHLEPDKQQSKEMSEQKANEEHTCSMTYSLRVPIANHDNENEIERNEGRRGEKRTHVQRHLHAMGRSRIMKPKMKSEEMSEHKARKGTHVQHDLLSTGADRES